jgi:hypothetical protein
VELIQEMIQIISINKDHFDNDAAIEEVAYCCCQHSFEQHEFLSTNDNTC